MNKKRVNFNKTITIEFYVDLNKRLHIIYNTTNMIFTEFWAKVEDAEKICRVIYEEFQKQFPKRFKEAGALSGGWKETFIKFVNNHLRDYNRILDVVILTNGDITIKLER